MDFCDRLKEMRNEKEMTQKELASRLNMSKNMICEYEKGRAEPTLGTLKKMADILECSIDYLVGYSDFLGNTEGKPSVTAEEIRLLSNISKMNLQYKAFIMEIVDKMKSWK